MVAVLCLDHVSFVFPRMTLERMHIILFEPLYNYNYCVNHQYILVGAFLYILIVMYMYMRIIVLGATIIAITLAHTSDSPLKFMEL